MGLERFQPIQPRDNADKKVDAPSVREFVALCSTLSRVLKPLTDCPLVDGQLITGVALTGAVATDVPHKLDRLYRGFIAVRNSTGATLDEQYSATDERRLRMINLTASTTCTVDLWVF